MTPPPDSPDADLASGVDLDQLADRLFGPVDVGARAAMFKPPHDRHRARREGSLCREAERAIGLALQAAADPTLQRLIVIAVEPAPDASRLMVLTSCPRDLPSATAEAALRHAAPMLRAELARSLQRRKTPELSFVALPDGATRDDADPRDRGGT